MRLSRIKKIINLHYHCSLPDPTPSAFSLNINIQISDFDTYYADCSCKQNLELLGLLCTCCKNFQNKTNFLQNDDCFEIPMREN